MTEPEEVSTCLTGSEGLVLSNHSKTAQRKTTKRNVEEHGKCFRGQILKKKKKTQSDTATTWLTAKNT